MSVMPSMRKAEKMLHVTASVVTGKPFKEEKKCLIQCREPAASGYVSLSTPECSDSRFQG